MACTSDSPEWMTSAPRRNRLSITLVTACSLPGIGWDEKITVSSGVTFSQRFSLADSSVSADIGSPCEPVQSTSTCPG